MNTVQDFIDEKYSALTLEQKQSLYETLKDTDTREDTLSSLKDILFKAPPPTGEEFLDPNNGWLPKNVIDSIYPHIKEDFLNIVNDQTNYFQLAFYGATRTGKTFLSRLLIIYTIIYIHHLREPALFYGLSPLTDLCIYFISFKLDKTRQLYLKPVYKILEKSKRFIQVKFQDQVPKEQEKYGCDKIVYSKAATVGEITLASGLQILLGNDSPNEIIGADIIQCYVSEIAFFIEEAGATEEQIFQLYTDAIDRIQATVGNDFLTWIYLDTSANYADSLIENYMIKTLQLDPECYFRWRSRWKARPHIFPRWYKGVEELKAKEVPEELWNELLLRKNLMFQIISGNGDIPAKIVTSDQDLKGIPTDLIVYVPIDSYKQFENNLIKSIKDIAGHPTSNESRFIQNHKYIDNLFSLPLKNVEGGLVADVSQIENKALYNKIKDLLFVDYGPNYFTMDRAPKEPRFIALDIAVALKGDLYGFCMAHPEWSRYKESTVVVVDLCFPFLPGDEGISLTAVEQFIIDLKNLGNVPIFSVTADRFQSRQTIENLKQNNIEAEILSVDESLNPYQELLSSLISEKVKCGKNIFLKNNLSCLERKKNDKNKEKIDHPKGVTHHQYYGDWEHALCGINEKDISDALAAVTYKIMSSNVIPGTIYEDENAKSEGCSEYSGKIISEAYKRINNVRL